MTDALTIRSGEEILPLLTADLPFQAKIEAIEAYFLTLPQFPSAAVHRFAPGLYCRELPMAAGVFWTSRVHKKEHIAIISQGDVSVFSEEGVQRYQAPATIITKPGTKRLLYTHADTVWTTIHATSLTESDGIEAIEAELTCITLDEYQQEKEALPCHLPSAP